jgi:hypothetical protein
VASFDFCLTHYIGKMGVASRYDHRIGDPIHSRFAGDSGFADIAGIADLPAVL